MKYRLQQYEDGSFGYLDIDGNERYNFTTESHVVCTQGEDEDRAEFIAKNGITFFKSQYGSDAKIDRLVNDENWKVRKVLAEQGYGLDKLVNDEDDVVRCGVAKGAAKEVFLEVLETLLNDDSFIVRGSVAEQGYGLNILINDENDDVRSRVACQKYKLDVLVNDESKYVRRIVARKGYGLDKLILDEEVRNEVEEYLSDNNLTLEQWKELYPEKCVNK